MPRQHPPIKPGIIVSVFHGHAVRGSWQYIRVFSIFVFSVVLSELFLQLSSYQIPTNLLSAYPFCDKVLYILLRKFQFLFWMIFMLTLLASDEQSISSLDESPCVTILYSSYVLSDKM